MSMKVDYTTPLTKEERSYLEERGSYADIQRADALNGVETPASGEGDGTGLQQVGLLTSEQRATERERLLARLEQLNGDSDDEDDSDDEPDPYDVWTVPELDAELKRRNLSLDGKKPDKVARLEQDDEQAAQNQA